MIANIRTRGLSISSILFENRIPSIRFRYGAQRNQNAAAPGSAVGRAAGGGAANQAQVSSEPIYDFQLPAKWRRRQLSDEEIAYINRGGPE